MARKLKRHVEEAAGELNLVPYMDIVVNLILFLMLSSTGLVQFGVINVSAPAIGGGGEPEEQKDPPLNLTVAISSKGFFVAGTGGVLPAPGSSTEPSIPKLGDKYDYAALTKKLIEVKSAFRNETKVIVTGDPGTAYEVIIGVMDASRQDGPNNILFPDVMLSPGIAQ
ncbi:MAG: biopolymer transporter ExbD [Deltaproteobacteria bacterium]|nr:biopolymer transporter ExbD [Deltaproteobacteria bacterium]